MRAVHRGMAMYHFDYRCDGLFVPDDMGTQLETFEEARAEAVRALGDLIPDELHGKEQRHMAIEVREGARQILQVQMNLETIQVG